MSWEKDLPAALARWLAERGIPARTGWTGTPCTGLTAPAAVVTVREFFADCAGFTDYLGEQYNEETARWEEVYGKKVRLTLGLDLYAPERSSEGEMQGLLEQIVRVLTLECPEGMQVGEFACAETRWDGEQRKLKREVSLKCTLWLRAAIAESGEFLDFELRGGWKI